MALPNLNTPTYMLTIPSTGETVKYRPFLVSEEKILLMAMEGSDQKEMVEALKQIVSNCTEGAIDVETLTLFDLEFIFLNLRSKSIGNMIELTAKISCEKEDCPKVVPFEVDLNEVEMIQDENHSDKIMLNDTVGVVMKYPSLDAIAKIQSDNVGFDELFSVVIESIDMIFDQENTYPTKEQSRKDLEDFINSFTDEQFKKIVGFFETMPRLEKEVTITCPNCGRSETTKLEGLQNFFA